MKYKILVLFILSIAFFLHGEEAVALAPGADPAPATATVKDGYALLNSLLTLFDNLTTSGTSKGGGFAVVNERLDQLAIDAKMTREANLIDNIFFNRYRRMLTVFKMIVTPVVKNELFENPFVKALTDFVWDVTYVRWTWGEKDGIAKMAAALEEEFVQLQFYLDSRQAREEFKKKIGSRILPPPPANKKPENK
ncbi:MAG: hypothetical protein NTW95_00875 [Candidatus Aminicenantes bacterium]|nr:hypothetical protein [Candidatus Aminicenantes bacterium]